MSDAQHTAADDLAFLRGLVDEDWRPGLKWFGATYLFIGLAVAAQVSVQWAQDTGLIALPDGAILAWIILVWVVYSIVQSVFGRWAPSVKPVGLRNRASGGAFLGMILSHLTMLAVFIIISIRMQSPVYMQLAALSFFAVQGGMWLVLSTVRPGKPAVALALGWLAATFICAFLVGSQHFSAAVGVAALALMVVPGAGMMRAARAPE